MPCSQGAEGVTRTGTFFEETPEDLKHVGMVQWCPPDPPPPARAHAPIPLLPTDDIASRRIAQARGGRCG
jgi:hypothetical protein